MAKKIQLMGISNAIVDVLTQVSSDFLEEIQAEPGSMNLIDMEKANQLYLMFDETKEMFK